MRNQHDGVPPAIFHPDRLAAVEATELAASPPETAFDRLASLAAELLETPLGFVTVVDHARSWHKSVVGAPADAPRWWPVEESFCQYVVGAESPCFFDDARTDPVARHNPAVQRGEIVAWAGHPVHSPEGHVLGTLCVVDHQPRTWSDRHRQVLETLADAVSSEIALRTALWEEQAQRARAEEAAEQLERTNAELAETAARAEELAEALSTNLLPPRLRPLDGVDVGARFRSARAQTVTGDFYDVFTAARDTPMAVVGDVMGKGPAAAVFASEVRYSVRAEAARTTRPSKVLTAVNRLLRETDRDEQFATAATASLRRSGTRDWMIRVALAGHPPPLVRRAGGHVEPVGIPGLPLGMFDDVDVAESRVRLGRGDALLLYTDGVVEARRGREEFGEPRLRRVLATARATAADELVRQVIDAAEAFSEAGADDDMAALALVVT